MTKVISIRLETRLLAELDNRSSELGKNRSEYVLGLVKRDLEAAGDVGRRFGSEDLIGSYRTGKPKGDNATVRQVIRERLR